VSEQEAANRYAEQQLAIKQALDNLHGEVGQAATLMQGAATKLGVLGVQAATIQAELETTAGNARTSLVHVEAAGGALLTPDGVISSGHSAMASADTAVWDAGLNLGRTDMQAGILGAIAKAESTQLGNAEGRIEADVTLLNGFADTLQSQSGNAGGAADSSRPQW